jgi:hypothetical protein
MVSKRRPVTSSITPTSISAQRFAELVNQHHSRSAGRFPLTNFTFFLGAGFSKAWSSKYPTGDQLFKITDEELTDLHLLARAADIAGFSNTHGLNMEQIKQIIYTLDMNAKYPAIRSRYIDAKTVPLIKAELSSFIYNRFQKIVDPDWYWFDEGKETIELPCLTQDQMQICSLLSKTLRLMDGSQGHSEGARFNFITTNYDWIVEAVIEADCESGEHVFDFSYRGITPKLVCGKNVVTAHGHDLVFNLLKLNGGFEVFCEGTDYHFDYRGKKIDDYRSNPPILIFPSREQDYTNPYFNEVFPKAVRLLNESKVLVIVGYSLPEADALLRFIIRQFCEDEADSLEKVLFYVDRTPDDVQLHTLQSVFNFAATTLETHTYPKGFAEWAKEVVALLNP